MNFVKISFLLLFWAIKFRPITTSCSIFLHNVQCTESVQVDYFGRSETKDAKKVYFIDVEGYGCKTINLAALSNLKKVWITVGSGFCSCICYDQVGVEHNCPERPDNCTQTNVTVTPAEYMVPPPERTPPAPAPLPLPPQQRPAPPPVPLPPTTTTTTTTIPTTTIKEKVLCGNAVCGKGAECKNDKCACKHRYYGNGKRCTKLINECHRPQRYRVICDANANCIDTPLSYSCQCRAGYEDRSSTAGKPPGKLCVKMQAPTSQSTPNTTISSTTVASNPTPYPTDDICIWSVWLPWSACRSLPNNECNQPSHRYRYRTFSGPPSCVNDRESEWDDCIILCPAPNITTTSTTTTTVLHIIKPSNIDNLQNVNLSVVDVLMETKSDIENVLKSRNNMYIFIAVLCSVVGGVMTLLSYFAGSYWYRRYKECRAYRSQSADFTDYEDETLAIGPASILNRRLTGDEPLGPLLQRFEMAQLAPPTLGTPPAPPSSIASTRV